MLEEVDEKKNELYKSLFLPKNGDLMDSKKIFFKDKCDRIFHFDSSKNEHLLWIQLSKNVNI